MKMAKTVLIVAAACALLLSCSGKGAGANKVYKIGVVQLVEHVALDASYKGFVDGLKEAGYEDGKNIKIDFQNAQGEQANCQTIAQKLINDRDDLILAIATPAAQAVANLTDTVPVPEEKRLPNMTVLSVAPLLAAGIRSVFESGSVSTLLNGLPEDMRPRNIYA